MRSLGLFALLLSAGIFVVILRRSQGDALEGSSWGGRSWMASGPKGENWPEPLPDEIADIARPDDRITKTFVWSEDLGIGYQIFEVSRGGILRGRCRVGVGRYFGIIGAIASAPLMVWAIAVLMASLRRQPKTTG